MLVKLEEVAHIAFSTRDPVTGSAINATGISVAIYESSETLAMVNTDITYSQQAGVGQYSAFVTCDKDIVANPFVVGNTYSIRVTATVGTVTDTTQIGVFQVSAANHGYVIGTSIPEIPAGAADGLFRAGDNTATKIESTAGKAFQCISPDDDGFYTEGGSIGHGMHAKSGDGFAAVGFWAEGGTAGAGIRMSGPTGGLQVQDGATGLFTEVFFGQPISTYIIMAGIGAGGGELSAVDQASASVVFDSLDNRTETFFAPDGTTPIFTVLVDNQGIRQTVTIL